MGKLTHTEYMKLKPIKRFWYQWKRLKTDFPTDKIVRIRTVPYKTLFLEGHRVHGYCEYKANKDMFFIYIERNKETPTMVDTLWHEYAHILTWHDWHKHYKHTKKFFETYGEIYSHYQDVT
jgi:hypothetical protein